MIQQQLRHIIAQAVKETFPAIPDLNFSIDRPDVEEHGDYSSNVALVLAKQVGLSPMEIATQLVDYTKKGIVADQLFESMTAAAPGFINFTLSPTYLLSLLSETKQDLVDQPKKILFEYGTPNTHKIPHIGHLFSYCYGESCARLLSFIGHQVTRDNYQGDVGLHVAKCLWAYQKQSQSDPELLVDKVNYLQQCYQAGSQAYETDETAKQEIDQLNRLIYAKDPSVLADWEKTRQWSIDYYQQFEARVGSRFDQHYFESQVSQLGVETVKQQVGTVFEVDDGAVIFRGEQYGLHTRVFVNRFGNPTYEAKDLGLAVQKKQDWSFDLSIITTAVEQNEYWRVVIKAIELVMPDYAGKLQHIGFGMINLTTGKMSSRTGKIVTAFDLVEVTKEKVKEYIQANRNYTVEETDQIAEIVAIGAIKYSFLKSTATKNISFDLESSIAFEGNSGPYLQYTYARCQSVLAKAGEITTQPSEINTQLLNKNELSVLRWFARFPEVVHDAAEQYSPHLLATFLFELAQRYSYFYNQDQILVDDRQLRTFRLALSKKVGEVLSQGLNLLGIDVADKI